MAFDMISQISDSLEDYSSKIGDESSPSVTTAVDKTMSIIDESGSSTENIESELEYLVGELKSESEHNYGNHGDRYQNHVYATMYHMKYICMKKGGRSEDEIDNVELFNDAMAAVDRIAESIEKNKTAIARDLAYKNANERDIVSNASRILASTILATAGELFATELFGFVGKQVVRYYNSEGGLARLFGEFGNV